MALPDLQFDIRARFPNLGVVAKDLFPTARAERVNLSTYSRALELQGRLTSAVSDSIEKARRVRTETAAIVYIAGGLTGVDEVTKERYGQVSNFLVSYGMLSDLQGQDRKVYFGYVPHLHGTDPIKHPNVTANEVRDIDHLWAVVVADAHINFKHPMAHGNAIEFGWAEDHLLATSYQNPEGNKLSRLVVGMNNIGQRNEYEVFQADGMEGLKIYTDEFAAWIKTFPERDPREFLYGSIQVKSSHACRGRIRFKAFQSGI